MGLRCRTGSTRPSKPSLRSASAAFAPARPPPTIAIVSTLLMAILRVLQSVMIGASGLPSILSLIHVHVRVVQWRRIRGRPDPINAVALLDEPTRRRLYDLVVSAERRARGPRPGGRRIGSAASSRRSTSTASRSAGLLETVFQRLGSRRGPGAGRPAKLYRRAAHDIAVVAARRATTGARAEILEDADRRGRRLRRSSTAIAAAARERGPRPRGATAARDRARRPVATARGARRPAARRRLRAGDGRGDRVRSGCATARTTTSPSATATSPAA